MKIAYLENYDYPVVIWDEEKIFEGAYLPQIQVIDNEVKERLRKLGFDVEKVGSEEFDEYCRKNGIEKEKKEEIEDILNNLPYLPQVADCESIVDKKDVEELDAEWFFEDKDYFVKKEDILQWDWDNYYLHWNGSNYRCYKILFLLDINAEETDKDKVPYEKTRDENLDDKCKYLFYKTNNKFFRIISSPYMGSLDEVDTKWGDWKEIEKNKLKE